jgi:hypothetical protein
MPLFYHVYLILIFVFQNSKMSNVDWGASVEEQEQNLTSQVSMHII